MSLGRAMRCTTCSPASWRAGTASTGDVATIAWTASIRDERSADRDRGRRPSRAGHCACLPRAGAMSDEVELPDADPALRAVVVVPARDEAARIAACPLALTPQRALEPESYEVIVIL